MMVVQAELPDLSANRFDRHCLTSKIVGHDGCVAALRREVPHRMRYERSDQYLLVLHRTGPVAIELNVDGITTRRVVASGGIHVVPPHCLFDFELLEPLSTLHLTMPAARLPPARADGAWDRPVARILDDPVLHHLLEALAHYVDRGGERSQAFENSCLRAIGDSLMCLPAMVEPTDRADGGNDDPHRERVHAAIGYMERNLSTPFSVADVAVAVGISASQFARNFTKVTGMSPQRYVSELRLMRARTLLATDLPIVGVALSCGFSNQEHFTNRFREKFGEPPGRWRRRRQG